MRRQVSLFVFLIFCMLPTQVLALGFGEVKLYSYLDEPLDAEIELLGAETYEPERILVSLASSQEFKRAGLSRPFLLSQMQFQIVRNYQNTVIRVTSMEAIRQPYLEFLMDLSWPGGRLVRGYTLLLDPPPVGIAPLAERRPKINPELFKGNSYSQSLQSQNTQNMYSQNMQPQNLQSQNLQSQNMQVNATPSNSHQHRFEKLFDERNGEENPEAKFNNTLPTMTIVSTSANGGLNSGVQTGQQMGQQMGQQTVAQGSAFNASSNAAVPSNAVSSNSASSNAPNSRLNPGQIWNSEASTWESITPRPMPIEGEDSQNQTSQGQTQPQSQAQRYGAQGQEGYHPQYAVNNINNVNTVHPGNTLHPSASDPRQSMQNSNSINSGNESQASKQLNAINSNPHSKNVQSTTNSSNSSSQSTGQLSLNKIADQVNQKVFELLNQVFNPGKHFSFDITQLWVLFLGLSLLMGCLIFIVILLRRDKKSASKGAMHQMNPMNLNMGMPDNANMSSMSMTPSMAGNLTGNMMGIGIETESDEETYMNGMNGARAEESKTFIPPVGNEMSLKLDLARHYLDIRDDVNALHLLEDVMTRGSEWEKQAAQRLLSESLSE